MEFQCQRLKELRWDSNLSQKQLAKALNIGYSTIQAYEQGSFNPSDQAIRKMAKFFGVSEAYLKGESDDMGRKEPPQTTVEATAETNDNVKGMPINQALSIVDKLEQLVRLLNDGAITEEEYNIIKKKIINT